ncbi:hypothetical protein BJV78DRAFT_107641 [Lactifluus subvellereus]|nr:hypothetical protein BJV78DRAFT_107641 [Lactifluus subvellereus]
MNWPAFFIFIQYTVQPSLLIILFAPGRLLPTHVMVSLTGPAPSSYVLYYTQTRTFHVHYPCSVFILIPMSRRIIHSPSTQKSHTWTPRKPSASPVSVNLMIEACCALHSL